MSSCPAVDLSDGDFEFGLTDFETYYMIFNVMYSLNNKFYFDKDDKVIVIPEGSYEIRDINEYLTCNFTISFQQYCERENASQRE